MVDYRLFWGKARRHDVADAPRSHPAAYHCLDVAAAGAALLRRRVCRPPAPWGSDRGIGSLAALLALHDIGKFSRPFQAKAPAVWPPMLGACRAPPDQGHGAVGLAMLLGPLADEVAPLLRNWAPEERGPLLGAVCGHHGRPVDGVVGRVGPEIADSICLAAAAAFAADVLRVLDPEPLPAPEREDPALTWWLAGFAVLADWIGSAELWFPYRAPGLELGEYWAASQPRAAAAVSAAGLVPSPARPSISLSGLVGAKASPNPVQALAGSLDLGEDGPALVLIEDQTGSGKTEAALLLAHRLMAAGRADGLFVALPTMATANAMYARLSAAYRRLFAEGAEPSLVLTHGGRTVHPGFQDSILREAAVDGPPHASEEDEPASAQCAAWIADDRRRAFLAAVGVGTIDQALLAVLPSRHAPLRLLGLHRRVLIVDEAHAYDFYMREELRRLIAFQAGLGGSTIVLSATLPERQRQALVAAFPRPRRAAPPELERRDYPLVTAVRRDGVSEVPCAGRAGLARRVEIERVSTAEQAAERVRDAAARGLAVSWVRNTVRDAGEAHAALASRGVAATLFHARFAMGDRQAIEADVMCRFGRDSTDRGGVVVATQVIEQSLDLDFDLMVTDLAPADLLIQRAGRVWRHLRPSRSAGRAALVVLSPEPVEGPAADWLGPALRGTGAVYPDHALLWRSARALFAAGGIDAPAGVRALVEAAYDEDDVPPGLAARAGAAAGRSSAEKAMAWQNLLDWTKGYASNAGAWASDVRTPTRLGEDGRRFRLATWTDGVLRPWCAAETEALAWTLSELSLPPRIATGAPPADGALKAAETAARAAWGAWERELPILALTQAGEAWRGVLLRGERTVSVDYSRAAGLNAE